MVATRTPCQRLKPRWKAGCLATRPACHCYRVRRFLIATNHWCAQPRSQFPKAPKVGARLESKGAEGEHPTVFTVMQVKGNDVLVDGNHPLAGRELRFMLTVTDVRAASAEELAHRHVHGEHGHHH